MRSAEFTLKDGLKKGLRRFKTIPRNEDTLVECHNLMPSEKKLKIHEEITFMGED